MGGVEGFIEVLPPELRREIEPSKSMFLRLGEECAECEDSVRLSVNSGCVPRRGSRCCSIGDTLGTEDETIAPYARELLLVSDATACLGLPLAGMDIGEVFPVFNLLGGLALPMFNNGIEGDPRLPPALSAAFGVPLDKLSRSALISVGIEI